MKNKENQSRIEGLVVLVLFGVFAVCILAVLFTGAGAYRRLVERQQDAYAKRTIPQYIATKVRQADTAGAVRLGEFGGLEALELVEWLGDEEYITRIYCYDGYLRELFAAASGEFGPEDGECILEAEQVDFSLTQGCLGVVVTKKDGEKTNLELMLRSLERGDGQ